jgi:galacturan 1,4-alpha-galacturonidase
MRIIGPLVTVCAVAAAAASAFELPPGVPRSIDEFREKHPLERRAQDPQRRTVQIRSSKNDTDDVSDDFLQGLLKANRGGILVLEEGKTYIIGKPLDLTFLDDIHIQWEGEVKVRCSL